MSKTAESIEKKAIKDYLKIIGVFYYHNLAGLGVYPGIPDLTAIKNSKVYQIEVKVGKNKQSDNQKEFQRMWEQCGGIYICGGLDEVMKIIK